MKKLLCCLVLSLSSMAFADAEHSSQGPLVPPGNEGPYGGGSVVCGKEIITAQLLDLWEAEAFKKLPITYSEASVDGQIRKALARFAQLNGQLPREISDTAWALYEQVHVGRMNGVPAGLSITPPSDVLSPFIPVVESSCEFKGLAAYEDTAQVLFVDYLLYDALRPTDKAALFIHEAFYKYLRDHYRVKNSIAARNITACLFTDTPCQELSPFHGVPEKGPLYKCVPTGWLESVVKRPEFDSEDYRMAEPVFYLYRVQSSPGMKVMGGFYPWRFQQTSLKKRSGLSLNEFEYETVMTKTYFDVQISSEIELDMEGDVIMSSVLGPKGTLDVVLNTFSSDTDPWKKVLGPRFSYRLKPKPAPGIKGQYLELNGFPLSCEKLR